MAETQDGMGNKAGEGSAPANFDFRARTFVHIIESPKPVDLLDGRTEGRMLLEALRIGGIHASYNLAVNHDMLIEAFGTRQTDAARRLGRAPLFLHLSMHGNEDGIGLTDGTTLSWEDLSGYLKIINKPLRGFLVVTLSTCHGFSGIQMAMEEKGDLPFGMIVGNTGDTLWHDAAIAYATFYHLMFKGVGFDAAVKGMCAASGDPGFSFRYGPAIQKDWIAYLAKMAADQQAAAARESSPVPGNPPQ